MTKIVIAFQLAQVVHINKYECKTHKVSRIWRTLGNLESHGISWYHFDLIWGLVKSQKLSEYENFSVQSKKKMMSENTYTSLQHSQERACRLLLSAKKRDGCWASWFNLLHQNLHTLHTVDKKSLIENQEFLKLMIISIILTTQLYLIQWLYCIEKLEVMQSLQGLKGTWLLCFALSTG